MSAKPARLTVEVRGEMQSFPLVKFFCLAYDLGRGVHDFARHEIAIALTKREPKLTDKVIGDIKVSPFDAERPAAYPLTAKVKWVRDAGEAHLAIDDVRLALPRRPSRWGVLFNSSALSQPLIGFYDMWDEAEWGPLEHYWDPPEVVLSKLPDHKKGEWLEMSFGDALTIKIPARGKKNA
jgi:hypothetical protein